MTRFLGNPPINFDCVPLFTEAMLYSPANLMKISLDLRVSLFQEGSTAAKQPKWPILGCAIRNIVFEVIINNPYIFGENLRISKGYKILMG